MALRFGAFTFDAEARQLCRDGASVALSPKAFRLLELLIDARPNPVTRETLYQHLWPDVVVEPGNLHGLVLEIRSALGGKEFIRTVHRVGYAFPASTLVEQGARYSLLVGDEEVPLRSGENVIGRDRHDAVVIDAAEVSRHHARLTVTGATVTLEDLGSKNGTFVGSDRLDAPREVHPGDEILLGTIRVKLLRVDAQASTATASEG